MVICVAPQAIIFITRMPHISFKNYSVYDVQGNFAFIVYSYLCFYHCLSKKTGKMFEICRICRTFARVNPNY